MRWRDAHQISPKPIQDRPLLSFRLRVSYALRLAHMLKSLVRVSRRVDKIAEQLVTDLNCHSEAHSDYHTPTAVGQHCKTVQPSRTARGDQGSVLREAGRAIPRSDVDGRRCRWL